jgi:hypothetical protein
MKAKQAIILVILLVVLGAASLLLLRRERSSWQPAPTAAGSKVLATFDPNAVTEVKISAANNGVTLTREADSWTVAESGSYPADFDRVRALVRRLWELKAVQDVAATGSQLERLQLIEPNGNAAANAGTLVELKDSSGKRVTAIIAGKTYLQSSPGMMGGTQSIPAGRYVMAVDGKNRVIVVGDPFSELASPAREWLKKDFPRVSDPRSISVQGPQAQWTLERAGANDPWKLDGASPDMSKIESVFGVFRSPMFDDVAPPADASKYDFKTPQTATVKDADGFTYLWTIGKLQGDKYPVRISINADLPNQRTPAAGEKPEDNKKLDDEFAAKRKLLEARLKEEKARHENWIYLFPQSTFTSLLVAKKDLLPPPPTPTPSPSPAAAPSPGEASASTPVAVPPPPTPAPAQGQPPR